MLSSFFMYISCRSESSNISLNINIYLNDINIVNYKIRSKVSRKQLVERVLEVWSEEDWPGPGRERGITRRLILALDWRLTDWVRGEGREECQLCQP